MHSRNKYLDNTLRWCVCVCVRIHETQYVQYYSDDFFVTHDGCLAIDYGKNCNQARARVTIVL